MRVVPAVASARVTRVRSPPGEPFQTLPRLAEPGLNPPRLAARRANHRILVSSSQERPAVPLQGSSGVSRPVSARVEPRKRPRKADISSDRRPQATWVAAGSQKLVCLTAPPARARPIRRAPASFRAPVAARELQSNLMVPASLSLALQQEGSCLIRAT